MNVTSDLFIAGTAPFGMKAADKARYLETHLAVLRDYHYQRCRPYAILVDDWHACNPSAGSFIANYPFLPVTAFKEFELRSCEGELAVIESSATTSGQASRIFVDKESRRRQSRSANMILADFIGGSRRPYVVFDSEETVRGTKAFSARGAAILSLAHLSSEIHFVMRQTPDGPELDIELLNAALARIGNQPFMGYGFTFMLYRAHEALSSCDLPAAHPDTLFLHSGGWKKLSDLAVDKSTFNSVISSKWRLNPERVVDFYGLVEQVGLAYPDCSEGVKHVPYWAEVLIRRADTLEPAEVGESGLIQLLNVLPLAGPNHSVLTEDIGRIERSDNCRCGRNGRAFVFEGRAPKSELRGCSDVVRR